MSGIRAAARALLSVADKSEVTSFARDLAGMGVELLATGGTRRALLAAGVAAAEVTTVTGFPEMLGGRVKTLHPRIHGGILARRHVDAEEMTRNGIRAIDLVVVNLYPFERAAANCDLEQVVEQIDIGGPAMLRAAAKNHRDVLAVVDAADYRDVARSLAAGGTSFAYRQRMAVKAFNHTAAYDHAIAAHLADRVDERSD